MALLLAGLRFVRYWVYPEMGSPREFENPRLTGLRMWPIKGFLRYLIFYRPFEDGIEIIRVLRGEQDITAILKDK